MRETCYVNYCINIYIGSALKFSPALEPDCFGELLGQLGGKVLQKHAKAMACLASHLPRLDQQMQCGGAEKKKRHGAET